MIYNFSLSTQNFRLMCITTFIWVFKESDSQTWLHRIVFYESIPTLKFGREKYRNLTKDTESQMVSVPRAPLNL